MKGDGGAGQPCLIVYLCTGVKTCLMGTITSVAGASHTCVLQTVAGETQTSGVNYS